MSEVQECIDVKEFTMRLIDSRPDGIKICNVAGSSLTTVVIPRSLLSEARKLPDIPARGIYYLLSTSSGKVSRVYVGQTVQGVRRLDDHNLKKDWWDTAIMFLDSSSAFSLDVVSGLEALAIKQALSNDSYLTDNTVVPEPYVSPYVEGFIRTLHQEVLFRLKVLGINLEAPGDSPPSQEPTLHTTRRGVRGLGCYRPSEGVFTVLAGSQIDMDHSPYRDDLGAKRRQELLVSGQIKQDPDGTWRLTQPQEFTSPSSAAVFVLGGSQNGRTEWVDEVGRTFAELYPRPHATSQDHHQDSV